MLDARKRTVLLEALRPPDDFALDRALATTFSLDLTALLVAPLAFSMFDGLMGADLGGDRTDTVESLDPFALLKAIRENAEKILVFCQAGEIALPAKYRRLLGYLESSVVPVTPGGLGVFHPKVWILRFCRSDNASVRYRFLCSSRNLTFDRSWDTLLRLDGELTQRANAFSMNHPLGEFVEALSSLAVAPLVASAKHAVAKLADEIRRVKFELPEGVESLRFHPLGIPGRTAWPFQERIQRLLIVSPFVTDDALRRLGQNGRGDTLISRREELDMVPPSTLDAFGGVHLLNDAAHFETEDEADKE